MKSKRTEILHTKFKQTQTTQYEISTDPDKDGSTQSLRVDSMSTHDGFWTKKDHSRRSAVYMDVQNRSTPSSLEGQLFAEALESDSERL